MDIRTPEDASKAGRAVDYITDDISKTLEQLTKTQGDKSLQPFVDDLRESLFVQARTKTGLVKALAEYQKIR